MRRIWLLLLLLSMSVFSGCGEIQGEESKQIEVYRIEEDGSYTAPEEVALYLDTYGELPENFITKKEA